jgi:hypothetical protein
VPRPSKPGHGRKEQVQLLPILGCFPLRHEDGIRPQGLCDGAADEPEHLWVADQDPLRWAGYVANAFNSVIKRPYDYIIGLWWNADADEGHLAR